MIVLLFSMLLIILFFALLIGIFFKLGSIRQAMKTPQERRDERRMKLLLFGVLGVAFVIWSGTSTPVATHQSAIEASHPFPFPARKP